MIPAPPHERSEGEPTERPGAVDPSDEDTGQHIAVSYGTGPECANAITAALTAARNAGREEMRERAARLAEGSSGPFPRGERIAADGTEGTELAIAMQHSLGGGRDAIAAGIRSLPLQAEGEDTPDG